MPPSYPFHLTIEVTFRDLDAMGHVNHAVYLTYMETARTRYLMDLLALKSPHDMPVILAEISCTYHSPAVFAERLVVGVNISRFGRKSFDMHYDIHSEDGRPVATGKTIMVWYDYSAGTTITIPDAFKLRVAQFQAP
jgi:acyl-CoA thioester hydrolase